MHEVNLIGRKERCSVQITDLNATLLKVVCMLGAVGIDRIPEDPICIFLADGSDVLQLFCRIILAVENEYAVAMLLGSVNDRTDKLICFSGITAVSYTHLDVYKRQVYGSGAFYRKGIWTQNKHFFRFECTTDSCNLQKIEVIS